MCENPDIIHTNTGVIHEGLKVAKRLKIPHVWHLREYQDKDFNWEAFPLFFCILPNVEKILCDNNYK